MSPRRATRSLRKLVEEGQLQAGAPSPVPKSVPEAPASSPRDPSQPAASGKRSLAATRMYLFDLAVRMFVWRDPARVEQCRQSLRDAQDRDGLMQAAKQMLQHVEAFAGPERAGAVRERTEEHMPAYRPSCTGVRRGQDVLARIVHGLWR